MKKHSLVWTINTKMTDKELAEWLASPFDGTIEGWMGISKPAEYIIKGDVKMTEREKLEYIINNDGECGRWDCYDCPLSEDTCGDDDDAVIECKRLLAEMGNEWKPLEVDNLPSDILTGDYEFETRGIGAFGKVSCMQALEDLKNGFDARLRKRQKPTVEEMAGVYCRKNPRGCMYDAYIAGYKAAKDE